MADIKTEDCLHAANDFRKDALKAHNVPYQWLALGATAEPDLGQPVFTPRRYVYRKQAWPLAFNTFTYLFSR